MRPPSNLKTVMLSLLYSVPSRIVALTVYSTQTASESPATRVAAPADLWLAAAVLSCAVGYVEGAQIAREIGAIPALSWAMILLAPPAAVVLTVLAPWHALASISVAAWTGFGYAGVMSMYVGSLAWYRGLAIGGTARIGQLNLAQPLLAITWSALLLSEQIDWPVPAA